MKSPSRNGGIMQKILIAEDEVSIAELISEALKKAGYECVRAENGMAAADILEENNFDLVLLDIMLPEVDGYELMEYIAPMGIPVIFITAKGAVNDRIKGLRMGAEDYIVKPFDVGELLARVEVVLRRYNKADSLITVGGVEIDLAAHAVFREGQEVQLTPREFELLLDMVRNKGIALYRESLFERVWQEDFSENSRTLDLHIQRLRKKLGWQDIIKTVHRIGYILDVK